ncbi:MAG: hypothetical protein MUO76_03650 [Anaerolineaceae bacterium]|nr:hypothetical protein [Anaerolineaceae bacterium]
MPHSNKLESLWPDNKPDFDRLLKVFCRDGLPDRVPFIELFADMEIIGAVLGEETIHYSNEDRAQREAMYLQRIRFCCKVAWDFVWVPVSIPFTQEYIRADDTAALSRGKRNWVNAASGIVNSWEDFENYPWPTAGDVHYDDYEFVSKNLPEGMKMIASSGGMLEWVMWLMGFVPFAMGIYEQPDLIAGLFDRIGEIHAEVYDIVAGMPDVGAFFLGDDMGYKSGTFIKPEHMRRYVFPKQKMLAEITHKHGLPFLLHACGNLEAIMDDLIEDVGIDGRHSFEDVILPVGEAKRRYGKRVSILGGVDMDMLASSSEEQVRLYTRRVLEECMPGGGYALGTGNSVANYIPLSNYLAMLDEGMKVGRYS